jgi:hypothetical protein
MSKQVYFIEVDERQLENVEQFVRKRMVEMITKEITTHSKQLAEQILQAKPLTKKRWYQANPTPAKKVSDD